MNLKTKDNVRKAFKAQLIKLRPRLDNQKLDKIVDKMVAVYFKKEYQDAIKAFIRMDAELEKIANE